MDGRIPNFVGALAIALLLQIPPASAAEPSGELAKKLAAVKFDHYAQAPGYSEGPTWLNGEVFFCSGALLRVNEKQEVFPYLALGPAGTVLRGDGHLIVCDNRFKAIVDVAPDGKVGVLADRVETYALRSLNDLTIDARGNIYWTDPEGSSVKTPIGNLFRLRPDGRVDRIATGLAFPNGIDVDPAGKYLYVIESQSKKILRYEVPPDDQLLGKAEVFYDLGGSGGDGCAFDAEGNLWCTDFHRPETGKGRITVLSPKAEVLAYLPIPAKVVSNICFGGPQHDEIFCTTGEPPGVFHAKVGVKGFKGHPGKPMPIKSYLNIVRQRPHPDAATLKAIAAVAEKAFPKEPQEKFSAETRGEIEKLLGEIKDDKIRSDMQNLLPEFEKGAARVARDRMLLSEVARLHGKATIEISAPDWLRSIAGDDSLRVLGRITDLDLNERTDGHKEPEKRELKNRVHDDWLKLVEGQDALRRIELSGTAVTSAGLVHLKDLTNLEAINICLTACDDTGFVNLSKLNKVRRMVVCASKITGSGFAHCGGMKQIESINLHSSPATDEGLAAIGKLPSLLRLEIVHTKVTDKGLANLANLVNLRQLHIHSHDTTEGSLPFLGKLQDLYEFDVYEKPASNQTLAEVAKLPKLRMLRLYIGNCDDEGVRHLAGKTTLEILTLNSPNVTDASIDVLSKLTNLRELHLDGSKISEAGRKQLRAALPRTEITPP